MASRQGRVGSWNGTMTKDSVQIVPSSMTWVRNNCEYMFDQNFFYYRQPAYIDMTHFLRIHLFLLGNYCPICFKCYEDNDYDSQMMQCGTCNHWVHAKCEDLTGECFSRPCCVPVSKRISLICQNKVKYLSCFKQDW